MAHFIFLVALCLQPVISVPFLVGIVIERGFSEWQAGLLASSSLAGFAFSCLFVYLFSQRLSWTKTAIIAFACGIAANLVAMNSESFNLLLPLCFITGFAAGYPYCLSILGIDQHPNPTRHFGWAMAAQAVASALYFTILPWLLKLFGDKSFFALAAFTLLLGVYSCSQLKAVVSETQQSIKLSHFKLPFKVSLALLGIFILYIALGGVASFQERVGYHAGFDAEFIGWALAIASVMGIPAGLLASWQDQRLGFNLPLVLVCGGQFIAITLLWAYAVPWSYIAALSLYNFCWTYVVPFHTTIVGDLDSSHHGNAVALTPAFQALGLSCGAALAGALLMGVEGFAPLFQMVLLLSVVSVVLMFIARRKKASVDLVYQGTE